MRPSIPKKGFSWRPQSPSLDSYGGPDWTLADMDLIEVHEAFGGQVACNLKAWEQGWKEPAIGKVDRGKLNQLGSSIAVGHPFAATGARIVTTLANEMRRRGARYGLVSICAAGAQASAMILERDA